MPPKIWPVRRASGVIAPKKRGRRRSRSARRRPPRCRAVWCALKERARVDMRRIVATAADGAGYARRIVKLAIVLVVLALAPAASASARRNCSPAESRALVVSFGAGVQRRQRGAAAAQLRRCAVLQVVFDVRPGRPSRTSVVQPRDARALLRRPPRGRQRLRHPLMAGETETRTAPSTSVTLVRRADQLPPTPYQGKGAIICSAARDTISVWSMGPQS